MKFNIARLDKVLLIQTLYYHASPKGYGEQDYAALLQAGEIVEGMSTQACKEILKQGARLRTGYLVDYYNGKPLKIEWNKVSRHQTIMSSVPYDLIHGRFRFLEALLNVFDPEEICITDKSYSAVHDRYFMDQERRWKELEMDRLLAATVLEQHARRGSYWRFDTANMTYSSSFLNGLSI
jgi:hypothetical protein